ncbi:MAG: hypothetical protein K9H63_02520, partial [Sphingobacteriaceae bacterium]|nr:hypothetical protein [Sphingobacteriaceae bacterium]
MHSINFYTPNGLKKLTLKLILLVAFSGILVNNAFSQGTASITGSGSVLTVSANSASVVDPDIVVTTSSDLTGCKVSITGGYVPGSTGDILDIQGSLPTGITQSYDNTRGILSFSGTAAASVWQELLRRVTLKSTSLSCYPEQRSVTFNLGASFLNPLTGHWYEFDATPRNWKEAKAYAATKSYNGRVGYLATITSAAENNYIWKIMASDAWVGGSDDYLEINAALGRDVYANQAAAEGKYYWVTGPEKGMQFTEGNIYPVTLTGAYANWNSREPNNSGSEHYTQLYSGNLGRWNDLNINPRLGTLIEYGDSPDDNVSNIVGFTKEIKVLGAASGSITGGNINVCTGSNSTTLTLVGNSGSIVRWESSFDNFYTTGTTINNTTNTYTATNVSQTTYYRAIVSCGGGTVYTASVTLTVNATASGNVTAQNNSICAGGEVNLTLSGKKGDVVKWQISTDNSNWTDIANTTTNLIETLTTAGTYYYRAVVETAGCGAAVNSTAYPITVTSGTPPVGGTMSAVTYYDSTPHSGTLTLSGYTGTISKWQSSTNGGINWTDISNTAATYSYSNISTTTLYRAVLINGSCGTAYSSRGGITFSAMPVITSFSPSTAGIGETVTITGTNFTNITSVSFGGTAASSFTVVSDTKIEAVVGAGTSGLVEIANSDVSTSIPGFTFIIRDFDGDGILDATDTDDDNDGIPDTDELDCSASTGVSNTVDPSPFYFVQWNSYVNGELKGTIDVAGTIVNVTVTNSSNSILQYRDNPYGGTAHWGPTPTGNPFNSTFRSSTLGEHKFVFDRPVNNPRFFINSLNKTLDLSQPGVILKSNGAFVGTPTGSTTSTLVGNEAIGTISFNGNLTQVSFTGRETEFYCNFSLGLSSIAD